MTAAAVGAVLRIDGFVYVGAVAVAMLAAPGGWSRRQVWGGLVAPAAAVFGALVLARVAAFGEWLPLPLQTKVLYKLMPTEHLVRYEPATSYLVRFFQHYPWPLLLALCVGGVVLVRRAGDVASRRTTTQAALALAMLTGYVAVVGDGMFGFRFVVALLPFVALLAGATVAAVAARSSGAAWLAMAASGLWLGVSNASFLRAYEQTSDPIVERESWWRNPALDPRPYFTPYYELYADLHDRIPARALTANNQAGLLPFLLDTENIDDLGLGSRFYATLPTATSSSLKSGAITRSPTSRRSWPARPICFTASRSS